MKTITKLLFALCCLALAFTANAQWWNAGNNPYDGSGGQPAIEYNLPFLSIEDTGTNSNAGIVLRKSSGTSTTGWIYSDASDRLRFSASSAGATPHLTILQSGLVGMNELDPLDQLHITGSGSSADIRLEASGSKYVRFYEGATQKGQIGHSGTNMVIQNDETGGIIEIDGQEGVDLRVNNDIALDVDNAGLVTIDKASEALRLSGSSSWLSFYNGGTYNGYLWHTNTNMSLMNRSAGSLFLGTNNLTRGTFTSAGDFGIGTTTPESKMHLYDGNGAFTGTYNSIFDQIIEDDGWAYTCYNGSDFSGLWMADDGDDTYAGLIYNVGASDLNLYNGSSVAMTIEDDGGVGIGTSSPLSDLHIWDSGNVAGIICERSDASNYVNLLSGTTGNSFYFARAKRFSIVPSSSITSTTPNVPNSWFVYGPDWGTAANAGNTGLGTDAPTEKLHVNGNLRVNATIITSDRRLKSDIADFAYGLEEVKKLQPVSFTYNGRGGTTEGSQHIGLIAQELQAVAPELVEEYEHVLYEYDEEGTQTAVGSETYLQIRDTEVKYMLMNSIKEMAKENEKLIEDNEELHAEINTLKDENEAMRVQLEKLTKSIEAINAKLNGSNSTDQVKSTEQNVSLESKSVAALDQNRPNPFHEKTTISYFIPEGETGAHINIFTSAGKLLKTVKINESGNGQLNLQANGITPGTYMYQLVTDAGVVGSKTMILMK